MLRNVTVTKQNIIDYWAIFWTMGLVRLGKKRRYWETSKINKGIYGNSFISNVMGYHKWLLLDRCMQANLEWIQAYFEKKMNELYIPFSNLSVDDDLDLWTGKYGKKKHNPKKADGTGIASWKIADEKKIIIYMFWENDTKPENSDIKLCEYWLQLCERKIPAGPYLFVIDAGTLGCLENALYLR